MSQPVNKVGHTSRPKVPRLAYRWAVRVTHSDHRWWPSLVSLGFVSSRSFQWYWWCHHWSFCVSPGSFSFFLSFLFLLYFLSFYWILCLIILQFEIVACHTCDSQVADIIYNSLNYAIFLNIFYSVILSFIYYVGIPKNSYEGGY
jgi:hypothetical protein